MSAIGYKFYSGNMPKTRVLLEIYVYSIHNHLNLILIGLFSFIKNALNSYDASLRLDNIFLLLKNNYYSTI